MPTTRDETNSIDDLLPRYREALGILEQWGIRIPESSRLRAYEKRLAVILEGSAPFLSLMPETAYEMAFDLREMDEISEIVGAFVEPPEDAAMERLRKLPSGAEDPDDETNASARDAQYELLLFAILRGAGVSVKMAEPDLSVDIGYGPQQIEAKRPKSPERVDDRVRKAVKQLDGLSSSIIAVSLDLVLRPTEQIVLVREHTALAQGVGSLVHSFVTEHASSLAKRVAESRVAALLFTTRMPALVTSTGHLSIGSSVHVEPVYDGDEGARALVQAVIDAFGGRF